MKNHDYEGDSFHILLEPNFGLSIYDPDIKLNTEGYSRNMEVIYSTEDGRSFEEPTFNPRDLVPGYDSEGDSSVVAEHIRRIRAKLAACGAQPYIETVWGCGYKWKR